MSRIGYCFAGLLTACGLGHSAALAADLPVKAPAAPVPYVAATNWSGFYAGGHVGWGWVDETATFIGTDALILLDPLGTSYNVDHDGFLGGLQAGYNVQIHNWVFGIGGDFSWTNARADTVTAGSLVASEIHTQAKTDWYATLTGRVGYAWNDVLVYGKGGVAWMHAVYGGSATTASDGIISSTDAADTRMGWTVGAGLEWAFAPHWSLFGEYNYMDFGSDTYTFANSIGTANTFDIDTTVSQAKLGVNYRF